jgi:uncharacterized membrane protein
MEQKAYKSWALWLAVAALIVFCVKEFFGLDISEQVNGFLNVLLPVLVGFGIINNPTNKSGIGVLGPVLGTVSDGADEAAAAGKTIAADPAAPRAPDEK